MPQDKLHVIKSMLKDAGAIPLPTERGHLKYRLPNGKMFVMSKTPSSPLSFDNHLSVLRRELRQTHPEISQRGRSLSKEKMAALVTVVNKPGDDPVPLLHDGPFKPSPVSVTPPDTYDVYEPEVEGWVERRTPPPPQFKEKEMSDILDRARKALEETKTSLADINSHITSLKIEQDMQLEKQIKLEDFIARQESVAREADTLLMNGYISAEVAAVKSERKKPSGRMSVPRDLIYKVALPQFGTGEFSAKALTAAVNAQGHSFKPVQIMKWLIIEEKKNTGVERVSLGVYRYDPNYSRTTVEPSMVSHI